MSKQTFSEEELLKKDFTIGDTNFRIEPMPAEPGIELWEHIRAEIGSSLVTNAASIDPLMPNSVELQAVMNLLALKPDFTRSIRAEMHKYVYFDNDRSSGLTQLSGNEDAAFKNIPVVASYYQVMVRSLAINFLESLREIGSMFQDLVANLRP